MKKILIRHLTDCSKITASDGTTLHELLHPDRDYPFGGRYSLAHADLDEGTQSRPHRLVTSEVYYILAGQGEMHIDDLTARVSAGDAFEIPAGSVQWLKNSGSERLEFLCIVDPAWQPADDVTIE